MSFFPFKFFTPQTQTILIVICDIFSHSLEKRRDQNYTWKDRCVNFQSVVCLWLSTGANEYLLAVSCVGCIACWLHTMELFWGNCKRLFGIISNKFSKHNLCICDSGQCEKSDGKCKEAKDCKYIWTDSFECTVKGQICCYNDHDYFDGG